MFLPYVTSILGVWIAVALAAPVQAGELTVSAASSLTHAFKAIAQRFERRHPDTKVLLNFGASGSLLQQMAQGAPVDVFASADQETMDRAEKQGWVKTRRAFARNELVLVVPIDSKLQIKRLGDLTQPGFRRIAIGNPASVPVGRYTRQALASAKLWSALRPKTIHTQNVRQALDYVARGEVDAGFVYATDAAVLPDRVKVALKVPLKIPILYPIAGSRHGVHQQEAEQFIDFVLSADGQAILTTYGFRKP